MSIKVMVFDFDGTLADTFNAIVQIANRLADDFGYKPLMPSDIERVRNLSARQIIKESGVPLFKIPFLLKRIQSELHQDIESLKPVAGIPELLKELKAQGKIIGILTSNSEDNVRKLLKIHNLDCFFSFICSEPSIFGKSRALIKLIEYHYFQSNSLMYIGDETRDISAAKKINIKVIAVTWGFNSFSVLNQYNPDFLVDHPRDVLNIIAQLD
ncbi:MAG: HAD-IA family hydrolase [Coleofasciculus chthonoplastes F3-SA18-01]|jgi:phosphoglycolate phosphatase|uniref:HAD-IA family hydrolase n=1 Tax=Coleofasciculus chthonoplastes TaxID=64178 RepID=UPI0032F93825